MMALPSNCPARFGLGHSLTEHRIILNPMSIAVYDGMVTGDEDRVVRLGSGKGQTGADIPLLEVGKIGEHLGFALTPSEQIQQVLHPDAHAVNTRATAALVWVERDAIHGGA
jgi:hypothetical protein